MPAEHGFRDRLQMSQAPDAAIRAILLAHVPGAVAMSAAHSSNDRLGTDFWVEHERGTHVSVDVKIRAVDFAAKPEPEQADDLALEIWSVVETEKLGWTRDPSRRCDYVLWYWLDTHRWCLLPFLPLCAVFRERWQEWARKYGTRRQYTPEYGGYYSECVFVPRLVVWREIYSRSGGAKG